MANNMWGQKTEETTATTNSVVMNQYDDKNSVCVIIKGMVVTGNIETDGDIILDGKVIGDIKCNYIELKSNGILQGNIIANNVTVSNSLKGNITCSQKLVVNVDTDIEGDVVADTVVCDGAIVGNIKCRNSLQIKETGSVKGNCNCSSFIIADGAVINGKLTTVNK